MYTRSAFELGPEVVAPHALVDEARGQHAARVEHEQLEQLVLGAGELGELLAHRDPVAAAVQPELLERHGVRVALPRHPPQERPQARLQLAHVEGLDQVVVGAGVEAVDAIGDGVTRGEHQHRHAVAGAAQAATHLEAVHARHAHIEHDGVGERRRDLGEALLAALGGQRPRSRPA